MALSGLVHKVLNRADDACVAAADMLEEGDGSTIRMAALVSLLGAVLATFLIVLTDAMLFADGSLFVFAISTGSPWDLKWQSIAARATTYALTVWPTWLTASTFGLSPRQVVPVNAVFFYGVQVLLYGVSLWLGARLGPRFLVYPVLLFVTATMLVVGFPSEILLAPGFLWIALFSVARARGLGVLSWAAYAGLVFSHELAVPAALAVAWLAIRCDGIRQRTAWRRAITIAALAVPLLAMLLVRHFGGGVGSDGMAIYVIDPRRVLQHPVLWLEMAWLGICAVIAKWRPHSAGRPCAALPCLAGLFAVPVLLILLPGLNVMQARYDARTVCAGAMLVLAVIFVRSVLREPSSRSFPGREPNRGRLPPFALTVLALQIGGFGTFLAEWSIAQAGERRVGQAYAREAGGTGHAIVTAEEGRARMTSRERQASGRAGIDWAMPYRAFVLADGAAPPVIMYDPVMAYNGDCRKRSRFVGANSRFSQEVMLPWISFACRQEPPAEVPTLTRRWKRAWMDWWRSLSAAN